MSDKEAVEMEDKKKVPKGEAKKKKKPASSSKANPKRDTSASEPAAGNPRMSVDSVRYDNDDEERAAAEKIFRKFDADGSGFIDINELRDLCADVGRPLTRKELNDAITVLDKDKNGTIEFEEFYAWFSNKLTGTATPRHLMLAEVRRKMRRYTASNVVMDTLGPALGIVVPTDWSWSRMVHESQSVWARMTAGTVFESSKKKRVRAIFNKYDTDKSGELDMDEFGVFCSEMGENYTHEQLEVALAEIDGDGNGSIDFEEFYKWWCADPKHSGDADFSNRMRNVVYGYRDTEELELAAEETRGRTAAAGGSGDPGLIAENRRLKAELAEMRARLDAVSAGAQSSAAAKAPAAKAAADDSDSDSFEALDKKKEASSDSDDSEKPSEVPRKKKGKRKSRKPTKLEDSDDYETSEDQGAKLRAAAKN